MQYFANMTIPLLALATPLFLLVPGLCPTKWPIATRKSWCAST